MADNWQICCRELDVFGGKNVTRRREKLKVKSKKRGDSRGECWSKLLVIKLLHAEWSN